MTLRKDDQLMSLRHKLSFLGGPCLKLAGNFIPGLQDRISSKLISSLLFNFNNNLLFSDNSLADTFSSHSTHTPIPLFCFGSQRKSTRSFA